MFADGNYADELKVVVLHDNEGYFAQGMEIDHGAEGRTAAAVKANFEAGLAVLIRQHTSAHGNLDGLLKATPDDTWAELCGAARPYTVSSVSFKRRHGFEGLPFTGIVYFDQRSLAAKLPSQGQNGHRLKAIKVVS